MTIDLVPTIRQIPIASLRLDGGTQIRQARSEETIADYAEKMRAGEVFPPVVAYYDGAEYWLADGFQRVMARGLTGASTIDVDVRPGTQRDAILFACGANEEHGSRRTNEDKRKAVETLLADPEWSTKSSEWIADVCRVGPTLVRRIKSESTVSSRKVQTKDGRLRNNEAREDIVKILSNDSTLTNTEIAKITGSTRKTVGEARKTLASETTEPRKSPIEGLLSTIVAVHAGWEGYAERFAELWPKATDEDRDELIKRLSECRRQASKFIHALEKM